MEITRERLRERLQPWKGVAVGSRRGRWHERADRLPQQRDGMFGVRGVIGVLKMVEERVDDARLQPHGQQPAAEGIGDRELGGAPTRRHRRPRHQSHDRVDPPQFGVQSVFPVFADLNSAPQIAIEEHLVAIGAEAVVQKPRDVQIRTRETHEYPSQLVPLHTGVRSVRDLPAVRNRVHHYSPECPRYP